MAFGTITSTSNTFGSVDGTATGSVPGTLSGSVGVPGPQGPAGSQGPQGEPGEGVPAGGTTGQALVKTSNSDYATGWTTLNLTQYLLKASNLSDLTNVTAARSNLNLGPTVAQVFAGVSGSSGVPFSENAYYSTYDSSFSGFASNQSYYTAVGPGEGGPYLTEFKQVELSKDALSFTYNTFQTNGDLIASYELLLNSEGLTSNRTVGNSWGIGIGGVTFPDSTVQSTAFPGFNNAALTGNPTAPTATFGDNDTSIATTAFVQAGLLGGTANARNLEVEVRNQSGSTIPVGSIVYISGATGNLPLITLAQANNDANSAQTIGFVKTAITNNGTGYVIVRGVLENINTSALTEGVQLYLSPTTAGTWTTTKPSAPQHLVYVGIVIRSHPTQGTILVAVQNGYELHELHDVALSSEANNDLLVYELSTDLWKNKSFATLGLAGLNSPTFSGAPSLPTGTIGVTQTAGNNTTALATTAFVTAAVPAFATDAEAQTGSSTTLTMSPSTVAYAKSSPSYIRLTTMVASFTSSGTGSFAAALNSGWNTRAPTSAAGYGIATFFQQFHSRGTNANATTALPWNKRFVAQFRYAPRTVGTDSNTVNRVCFGKGTGNVGGDLTLRGIEVRQVASNALELLVHDGTTLTTVATSTTVSSSTSVDLRIVSDGTGNVTLFSNDVQIATTSAGPSTAGSTQNAFYTIESQNLATITGTSNGLYVAEISFEFAI
jgi:hypothetical protein